MADQGAKGKKPQAQSCAGFGVVVMQYTPPTHELFPASPLLPSGARQAAVLHHPVWFCPLQLREEVSAAWNGTGHIGQGSACPLSSQGGSEVSDAGLLRDPEGAGGTFRN